MRLKEVLLPLTREIVSNLNVGDEVRITGDVITMRDAALNRLSALLQKGEKLPFELLGEVIFHAGPTPPLKGRPCGAIGPTTSSRMDGFLGMLFEMGVLATIGKGPRSSEVCDLHARYGTVYFACVGGVGALYGGMVKSVEKIAWDDLGPEAIAKILIEGLPAVVAIDSKGRDYLREEWTHFRHLK